jgi:phage tail sheath gpL-like
VSSISIVGFSPSYKVPGFFGETVYGAGQISTGSAPIKLLVVGFKTSSGTATLDGTPVQVTSSTLADTLAGAGGEGARMLYQALRKPGVNVWYAAPTPAVGSVAAEATITITATTPHAATGEWTYRIGGETVTGPIGTTDAQNTIATNIAAVVNSLSRLPVTATVDANEVTLTAKCAGVRGNQYILFQDTTELPGTVTSAIAGGSSVTGGGVFFTSGAGTEDVSALLTTIFPQEYGRIAFAQNDATNAARWETHLYAAAGVLEGRLQHGITGVNGSLSAATSLAQTTFNAERVQVVWMLYSETHPSEMAARFGAERAVTEEVDPAAIYDGIVLDGIAPQSQNGDWASRSTQQVALSAGVTPLVTNESQQVVMSRSITTKCLTNGFADYRTLDTANAVVPDYVRRSAELIWYFEFFAANKRVAPDPAPEQKEAPAGTATPSLWAQRMSKMMLDLQSGAIVPSGRGVVINVESNPPIATYDSVAKRIMSIIPVETAPGNHQIGVSVREITSA